MGSRMDKYNSDSNIPKRSDKNKELYRTNNITSMQ